MIVLGTNTISAFARLPHDSSSAIVSDGQVIACAEEERFVRKKNTRLAPLHSRSFCLHTLGIELKDVDYLAIGNNPYSRLRNLHLERSLTQTLHKLMEIYASTKERYELQKLVKRGVYFVDHHLSHAASAYYGSGFSEANVLVIDSAGESESVSFFIGRGTDLKLVWRMLINGEGMPSVGKYYGLISKFIGFTPFQAGRTMGLAPYGTPLPELLSTFSIENHNRWTVDGKRMWEIGKRFKRGKNEALSNIHRDMAATAQLIAEQSVINLARDAFENSKIKNFVLAGGVALNCNINTKLLSQDYCDKLFVPPMANDSGIALGAALYVSQKKNSLQPFRYEHSYFGPEYSAEQIERALLAAGLIYSRLDDIEGQAAKLICNGKIIGWFQGRMEIGPRALGNRSILGDPTAAGMQDKINGKVKKRELWRPFGAAVIQENATQYFAGTEKAVDSPFMLYAFPIKDTYRTTFPAVTHVDGSCRIQTVTLESNPRFYRLLKSIEKINGHAMVLNTSFNVDGEPIVCSPTDAIRDFLNSGMEALVIGDYLVEK